MKVLVAGLTFYLYRTAFGRQVRAGDKVYLLK